MSNLIQLSAGSFRNKRQAGSLPEHTTAQPISKASEQKHKQSIIPPNGELEPEPSLARRQNPLNQHGHHQKNIKNKGLESIESDVAAKARVPDDAEVEGKKRDKRGIRDGVVDR